MILRVHLKPINIYTASLLQETPTELSSGSKYLKKYWQQQGQSAPNENWPESRPNCIHNVPNGLGTPHYGLPTPEYWLRSSSTWISTCLHVLRTCCEAYLAHSHSHIGGRCFFFFVKIEGVSGVGAVVFGKLNEFSWPNIIITWSFASRNGVIVSFLKRFRHFYGTFPKWLPFRSLFWCPVGQEGPMYGVWSRVARGSPKTTAAHSECNVWANRTTLHTA